MKIFISISLFISFILDLFIFYFLPFSFNNISFIFPMFFICTNILLFKYISKDNYYIYLIFVILYSSIFLGNINLGLILFFSIYYLSKLFRFNNIIFSLLLLFIYDLLFYLILVIFMKYSFSLSFYFYKVFKSIFINVFFLYLFNLVLEKRYS